MPNMQYPFGFYGNQPIRPKRPEYLFFCFLLDIQTSGLISWYAQWLWNQYQLRGALLARERLHVSVQCVGKYARLREKYIFAAAQAAKTVAMRAFEIRFPCLTSFKSLGRPDDWSPRHPLVLLGDGGDALYEFHEVLGTAMEKNGLGAAMDFTPHLTLYYGPEWFHPQAIEPFRFVAREFVLIHSERGLGRYHILGRWPLDV